MEQQQQQQSQSSKLDIQKYSGKNVDNVIEELKNQGYTTIKYDTHRLIQARPLSPIQDLKTIQIYVDSSTNTVHQIVMKH